MSDQTNYSLKPSDGNTAAINICKIINAYGCRLKRELLVHEYARTTGQADWIAGESVKRGLRWGSRRGWLASLNGGQGWRVTENCPITGALK